MPTRMALVWKGCAVIALGLTLAIPAAAPARQTPAPVRVAETAETFTLSNGVITAVVNKRNGDLLSMTYKGVETITPDSAGHSGVYWSHDATGGRDVTARVTIDPKANGGERAEVSIKGISGGVKMGHGPGTPSDGDLPVDIDIRFAIERGQPGVYTYTAFDHRPDYPAGVMGEARIAVELEHYFDLIHVDDARSGKFPLFGGYDGPVPEDKYDYVTRQADERAYGWTSSKRKLGWFLLNPSAEYLSGGPNKSEFVAHGEPTVLNYWKSSHNGGANVTLAQGEPWQRVVGPFMFYVNEGPSHKAMIADARAKLKKEEARWPYGWVKADGYAPPQTRSDVTGQLVLDDPLSTTPGRYEGPLTVGLTNTPYTIQPPPANGRPAPPRVIQWQQDAKNLQFWSRNTDPSGRFTVPKVSPGKYTLYAYASGVIGEFARADVVVDGKGGTLDLGKLTWKPVRRGRTLWQVGMPDHDAVEFNTAAEYFKPAIQLRYGEIFPQGVNYRVGTSSPGKDWFFAQAPKPRPGLPPVVVPFSGLSGNGEATPYNVTFDLPADGAGAAVIRAGFTTYTGPGINVTVNGKPVGAFKPPLADNAFPRHQIYGLWSETEFAFDGRLLRKGQNTVTLTVPGGSYNNVAVWDYVRLELDEKAQPPATPAVLALADQPPVQGAPRAEAALVRAPSAVLTVHDDERFGLPGLNAAGRRFETRAGSLYVHEAGGKVRRLIGPAQLDKQVLGVWRPSPSGKLVAFAAAPSAAPGELQTVRVINADTGKLLPDSLSHVRYTALTWTPDGKGFFYSRVPIPAGNAMDRYRTAQEVYYHRLGANRAADRRYMASDRGGMIHYAELTDDGRWLVVNGSVDANGKADISLVNLTLPHPDPFKAMRTMRNNWQFSGSAGALLYFVTDQGAATKRLVSMNTATSNLEVREVIAAGPDLLQAARIKGGKVYLSYRGAGGQSVRALDLGNLSARGTVIDPWR